MSRFYNPHLAEGSFEGTEAHHAYTVLRLREGDTCTVFNGTGKEAKVRITSASKQEVAYDILSTQEAPACDNVVRLVQALPKRKAMEWILQKVTELGVTEIQPLLSERSVAHIKADETESKQEKWAQVVMEACKQCGQNNLPEVAALKDPTTFLANQGRDGGLKLIASLQPDAKPLHKVIDEARAGLNEGSLKEISIVVGPEGDFTPAEMADFRSAGYAPITLGPNILRTETASLYLLSTVLYELQRG